MKRSINIIRYGLIILMGVALYGCSDLTSSKRNIKHLANATSAKSNTKAVFQSSLANMKNGILIFANKKDLLNAVTNIKGMNHEELAQKLGKYYDHGFDPLRAVVAKNDIARKKEIAYMRYGKSNVTNPSGSSENTPNPLKEAIGDDAYTEILNNNGEVQVGDSVYKYTTQGGLYFVQKNDTSYLNQYLKNLEYNTKKPSFGQQTGTMNMALPCGSPYWRPHLLQVNDRIMRFYNPSSHNCYSEGPGYVNNTPTTTDVNKFIANLPICHPKNGTFSWLFGTDKVCIDKFDKKHRVKTKFWDQNYFLYKSIGAEVVHQHKSFFIWWGEETDEMRLGINHAYFQYTLTVPYYGNYPSGTMIYNNKVYNKRGQQIGIIPSHSPFPFPFNTNLKVIVDLHALGLNKYTITGKKVDQLIQSNVYSLIKNQFEEWSKPMPQEILTEGVLSHRIILDYRNTNYKKEDAKKIRKIFDWQFQAGFAFGLGPNGQFLFNGITIPHFYNYTNTRIDLYGIARQGNTWKGNRLVYKQ